MLYEGSGANAELALSLLLGALIITLPLTIASVGRRLWIRYRFTNRRLVVITDSPLLKREVQVGAGGGRYRWVPVMNSDVVGAQGRPRGRGLGGGRGE